MSAWSIIPSRRGLSLSAPPSNQAPLRTVANPAAPAPHLSPLCSICVHPKNLRFPQPSLTHATRTLSSYPKWHGHLACDLSRQHHRNPKRPVSLCTSLQPSPSPHRRKTHWPGTNTPSHHSAASASIPKICGSPNPPSRTPQEPCPLILSPGSPPASRSRIHSCPFVPFVVPSPAQRAEEPCPLIQSGTGILPVTSPASTTEEVCPIVRPWEVVANRVGSDIVSERQSYPLNFRQLEENYTRPNAPFADGYSTRYSEIIHCQPYFDSPMSKSRKMAQRDLVWGGNQG